MSSSTDIIASPACKPALCLRIALCTLLASLAACRTAPPAAPASEPDVQVPAATREGAAVYRVDPANSEVRILVYRTGSLARLGHNHVISSNGVSGEVYFQENFTKSGFEIIVPVDSLIVDDPALRAAEGEAFAGEIPPEDIAATRENMLGDKVLNAADFPAVEITSVSLTGRPEKAQATVQIRVRGINRIVTVPLSIEFSADTLTATGEMEISHTLFGMTPFSVMLGALAVQDRLPVKFRISAQLTHNR